MSMPFVPSGDCEFKYWCSPHPAETADLFATWYKTNRARVEWFWFSHNDRGTVIYMFYKLYKRDTK